MANMTTELKIVTIIYYAEAVLNLLGGLIMLLGGGLITKALQDMGGMEGMTAILGGVMIIMAIIMIAMAVLYYFIAKELKELKKWAYVVAIILSVLGILGGLISLAGGIGIVGIIINGYILYALLINKETKALFQ